VDGLQAEHKPEALAKAKAKAKANTDLMLRSSAMAAPLALLPALPDLAMRGPKGILQPIVRAHPPASRIIAYWIETPNELVGVLVPPRSDAIWVRGAWINWVRSAALESIGVGA